jgi:hypothetical protein
LGLDGRRLTVNRFRFSAAREERKARDALRMS